MRLKGNLLLLGAAFIWGTTFVTQMTGMEQLGPFTYAMSRYLLAVIFMLGMWCGNRGVRERERAAGSYRSGWRAGLIAGAFMLVATSLQQLAMVYTTAGKTAFITALYIIIVPLGAMLLFRKKMHGENWGGAIVAIVGLYMLSIQGELGLSLGDAIVFVSSFFWAAQILYIDRRAAAVNVIELATAQMLVCFVGSTLLAVSLETIEIRPILESWFPIFYGGVMSGGIAFTLQIVGQKYAEPAQAAIIMSFESVFGVIASAIFLGEIMTTAQMLGCALMFAGMIVTQLGPMLRPGRAD